MATDFHRIVKTDDDRQVVFGWANISVRKSGELITDHHGHQVPIEELETAAYIFNLAFRESGERHQGVAKGHLIESFVVTKEKLAAMGLPPDALPQGWWVGFHVEEPEVFQKIKSDEYQMFSIEGLARLEEVKDAVTE